MSEKGTKVLIGAFVLGSLALLTAGILLLGMGSFSGKNPEFVLYFDSSLRGLITGAPVHFKGVRVGKVVSIQISAEPNNEQFRTPVVIELDKSFIVGDGRNNDENFMANPVVVDQLIRQGLRARLGMQSFITGQLTVDLDIMPQAAPVDPTRLRRFRGLQQIPTVPSSLDAVLSEASQIPVQEIAQEALSVLRSINAQLQGLDLAGISSRVMLLSDEVRGQVQALEPVIGQASVTLNAMSALIQEANGGMKKTLLHVDETLADLSALSETSRRTMEAAAALLQEDSTPMLEFFQTLQSLRSAAAAVNNLATLLELKPDALLFGRGRQ